jgi:hypothetical protein
MFFKVKRAKIGDESDEEFQGRCKENMGSLTEVKSVVRSLIRKCGLYSFVS